MCLRRPQWSVLQNDALIAALVKVVPTVKYWTVSQAKEAGSVARPERKLKLGMP